MEMSGGGDSHWHTVEYTYHQGFVYKPHLDRLLDIVKTWFAWRSSSVPLVIDVGRWRRRPSLVPVELYLNPVDDLIIPSSNHYREITLSLLPADSAASLEDFNVVRKGHAQEQPHHCPQFYKVPSQRLSPTSGIQIFPCYRSSQHRATNLQESSLC